MAVHEIDLGSVRGPKGTVAHNLLDNSMFEVAQAGYGGQHGAARFACDRWECAPNETFSVASGELTLTTTVDDIGIWQHVPLDRIKVGQTYTFVLEYYGTSELVIDIQGLQTDPRVYIYNASTNHTASSWTVCTTQLSVNSLDDVDIFAVSIHLLTAGTGHIRKAALYEGAYTADSLPAYIPKGYAAELAECQRYFEIVPLRVLGYFTNKVYFSERFAPKRIAPTVILNDVQSKNLTPTVELWSGSVNYQTGLLGTAITAGETYYYAAMMLNADL